MTIAVTARRGRARVLDRMRRAGTEAVAAAERTPLEVLLGVVAWLGFASAVQADFAGEAHLHLLVAVALALPLVYTASLLHAVGRLDWRVRWLASGLAVILSAVYAFRVFTGDAATEGWRFGLLLGAAWATLLSTPLVAWPHAGERRARVHGFALRLAARVAGVGLYVALLYLGLAAALAAIGELFNLTIHARAWPHLFGVLFLLLPPWAVAAGLPLLLERPAEPGALAVAILRRVGSYLLMPLVGIYMAIVYAYMIRMAVTGEIPNNIVSPVVLGAGVLVLAAVVLLEPLRGRDDAHGLTRLAGLLPPLLLPLAALAFWAVVIRLGQYGWTEFRYARLMAVVALGGFALAGTWQAVRRAPPPLALLPPVGAIVLLLMAIGPWSASAVSYRDQKARLVELLAQVDQPRLADRPGEVGAEAYAQILDVARYVGGHFGWDEVAAMTPSGELAESQRWDRAGLAAALAVRARPSSTPMDVTARLAADAALPGVMAGTAYGLDGSWSAVSPGRVGTTPVRTDTVAGRVELRLPGQPRLSADLGPLLAMLAAEAEGASEVDLRPDLAVLPLRDTGGEVRGQLLLSRVGFRVVGAGEVSTARLRHWGGMAILAP